MENPQEESKITTTVIEENKQITESNVDVVITKEIVIEKRIIITKEIVIDENDQIEETLLSTNESERVVSEKILSEQIHTMNITDLHKRAELVQIEQSSFLPAGPNVQDSATETDDKLVLTNPSAKEERIQKERTSRIESFFSAPIMEESNEEARENGTALLSPPKQSNYEPEIKSAASHVVAKEEEVVELGKNLSEAQKKTIVTTTTTTTTTTNTMNNHHNDEKAQAHVAKSSQAQHSPPKVTFQEQQQQQHQTPEKSSGGDAHHHHRENELFNLVGASLTKNFVKQGHSPQITPVKMEIDNHNNNNNQHSHAKNNKSVPIHSDAISPIHMDSPEKNMIVDSHHKNNNHNSNNSASSITGIVNAKSSDEIWHQGEDLTTNQLSDILNRMQNRLSVMTADDEEFPKNSPTSPSHYHQRVARLLSGEMSVMSDLTVSNSEINTPMITPVQSFRLSTNRTNNKNNNVATQNNAALLKAVSRLAPTLEVKHIQQQQRNRHSYSGGTGVNGTVRGRSLDRPNSLRERSKSPSSSIGGTSSEARGNRPAFAFGRAVVERGRDKTPVENINSKYNSRYPNYLRGRSKSPSASARQRTSSGGRSQSPALIRDRSKSPASAARNRSKSPTATTRSFPSKSPTITPKRSSSTPPSTSNRSKSPMATSRFFTSPPPRSKSPAATTRATPSTTPKTTTPSSATTNRARSKSPAVTTVNRSSTEHKRSRSADARLVPGPKLRDQLKLPATSPSHSPFDVTISFFNRVRSHSSPRPSKPKGSSVQPPIGSIVVDSVGSKVSLLNTLNRSPVLSPAGANKTPGSTIKDRPKPIITTTPQQQSRQRSTTPSGTRGIPNSALKTPPSTANRGRSRTPPATSRPSSTRSAPVVPSSAQKHYMMPLDRSNPGGTPKSASKNGAVSNLYRNSTEKRASAASWYASNYNSGAVERNLTSPQKKRERSSSRSSVRNRGGATTTTPGSTRRPSSTTISSSSAAKKPIGATSKESTPNNGTKENKPRIIVRTPVQLTEEELRQLAGSGSPRVINSHLTTHELRGTNPDEMVEDFDEGEMNEYQQQQDRGAPTSSSKNVINVDELIVVEQPLLSPPKPRGKSPRPGNSSNNLTPKSSFKVNKPDEQNNHVPSTDTQIAGAVMAIVGEEVARQLLQDQAEEEAADKEYVQEEVTERKEVVVAVTQQRKIMREEVVVKEEEVVEREHDRVAASEGNVDQDYQKGLRSFPSVSDQSVHEMNSEDIHDVSTTENNIAAKSDESLLVLNAIEVPQRQPPQQQKKTEKLEIIVNRPFTEGYSAPTTGDDSLLSKSSFKDGSIIPEQMIRSPMKQSQQQFSNQNTPTPQRSNNSPLRVSFQDEKITKEGKEQPQEGTPLSVKITPYVSAVDQQRIDNVKTPETAEIQEITKVSNSLKQQLEEIEREAAMIANRSITIEIPTPSNANTTEIDGVQVETVLSTKSSFKDASPIPTNMMQSPVATKTLKPLFDEIKDEQPVYTPSSSNLPVEQEQSPQPVARPLLSLNPGAESAGDNVMPSPMDVSRVHNKLPFALLAAQEQRRLQQSSSSSPVAAAAAVSPFSVVPVKNQLSNRSVPVQVLTAAEEETVVADPNDPNSSASASSARQRVTQVVTTTTTTTTKTIKTNNNNNNSAANDQLAVDGVIQENEAVAMVQSSNQAASMVSSSTLPDTAMKTPQKYSDKVHLTIDTNNKNNSSTNSLTDLLKPEEKEIILAGNSGKSEKIKIINSPLTTDELRRSLSSKSNDFAQQGGLIPEISVEATTAAVKTPIKESITSQPSSAIKQTPPVSREPIIPTASAKLHTPSSSSNHAAGYSVDEFIVTATSHGELKNLQKIEIINSPLTTEELKTKSLASASSDGNDSGKFSTSSKKKNFYRTSSRENIVIVEQPSPPSSKSPKVKTPKTNNNQGSGSNQNTPQQSQPSIRHDLNEIIPEYAEGTPIPAAKRLEMSSAVTSPMAKHSSSSSSAVVAVGLSAGKLVNQDEEVITTVTEKVVTETTNKNRNSYMTTASGKKSVEINIVPTEVVEIVAMPALPVVEESVDVANDQEQQQQLHEEQMSEEEKNAAGNNSSSKRTRIVTTTTTTTTTTTVTTNSNSNVKVLTDIQPIENEDQFLKLFTAAKMVTLYDASDNQSKASSKGMKTPHKSTGPALTHNPFVSSDASSVVSSGSTGNKSHVTSATATTTLTASSNKRKKDIFMPSLKHTLQKTIDTVYKVAKMKEDSKVAMTNIQSILSKSSSIDFDDDDYYQSPAEFINNMNNNHANSMASHHFHNSGNAVLSASAAATAAGVIQSSDGSSSSSVNSKKSSGNLLKQVYGYKKDLSVRNIQKLLSLTNYPISPSGTGENVGAGAGVGGYPTKSPRSKRTNSKSQDDGDLNGLASPVTQLKTEDILASLEHHQQLQQNSNYRGDHEENNEEVPDDDDNEDEFDENKSKLSQQESVFSFSTIKTNFTQRNSDNKPLELYTTEELIAEMNRIADLQQLQEEDHQPDDEDSYPPEEEEEDDNDGNHPGNRDEYREMKHIETVRSQVPFATASREIREGMLMTTTTVDNDDDSRRFTLSLV